MLDLLYSFVLAVLINILRAYQEIDLIMISVKPRSLNARFYVSNKFILNSSKLIFKLEQWQVEVESTERKVKRLKSETIFLAF